MRQCVSKAEAEGVPAGSRSFQSDGRRFRGGMFPLRGLDVIIEWASDGGCAVVASSRARKLNRVGRLSGEKGMPNMADSGNRAWSWIWQADRRTWLNQRGRRRLNRQESKCRRGLDDTGIALTA